MAYYIELTKYAYEVYQGTGGHLVLFLLCVLFLALFSWSRPLGKSLIFPSIACMVLFVFNPLFMGYVQDEILSVGRAMRFYWLLPIDFLLAFMMVRLVSGMKEKMQRIKLACVCVAALCLFGTPIFTKENFVLTENLYKVSDSTIELCGMLHELSGDETVYAVMPEDNLVEVRQYDATICVPYTRGAQRAVPGGWSLHKLMITEPLDLKKIDARAANIGCNFILLETEKLPEETMEHYEKKAEFENLTIFQIN